MTVKSLRKQLAAAIAMTLVATVALGSSTYAWFVNNTKVTADTTTVSATTANTLLIKDEDGKWATTTTYTDTNTAFVPVSTIGKESTDDFVFYIQNHWAKDTSNEVTVDKVAEAAGTEYWTRQYQIKASQACKLYLDTDTVFNASAAEGATNNMNKVLRLALVISDSTGNWEKTVFYQIDPDPNAAGNYNTTLESLSANGTTIAVASMTKAEETDSFGTPVAGTIVSAASKAIGGTGTKALATPSSTNGLDCTVGTADMLHEFTNNNEIVNIKAYIWMEGCDYDCNNSTVNEITGETNTVSVTLGFCAGQ